MLPIYRDYKSKFSFLKYPDLRNRNAVVFSLNEFEAIFDELEVYDNFYLRKSLLPFSLLAPLSARNVSNIV